MFSMVWSAVHSIKKIQSVYEIVIQRNFFRIYIFCAFLSNSSFNLCMLELIHHFNSEKSLSDRTFFLNDHHHPHRTITTHITLCMFYMPQASTHIICVSLSPLQIHYTTLAGTLLQCSVAYLYSRNTPTCAI